MKSGQLRWREECVRKFQREVRRVLFIGNLKTKML
jgi:hypothetical protein